MPSDGMSTEAARASATPAPMAPPAGAPDTGEAKPNGMIEQAKANVQIAIGVLEQSLPLLGGESEEGRAVHSALGALYKKFAGKKSQDIVPAELMQLLNGAPDQYKDQMMQEPGPGMTSGGIPNGPHIPANVSV